MATVTATYIKQGRKKEDTEPTSRLMDLESGITKYQIQEEETNESCQFAILGERSIITNNSQITSCHSS